MSTLSHFQQLYLNIVSESSSFSQPCLVVMNHDMVSHVVQENLHSIMSVVDTC